MANFLNTNFVKELHPTSSKNSKTLDTYVNVIDDFKTNLMWLSIFVPCVDGVGMRLPVNYRQVLQANYFAQDKDRKTIHDSVYTPDGDTFQNSPIKIAFFAGFSTTTSDSNTLNLNSVSMIDVNASEANLQQKRDGVDIDYSNMTLSMESMHCLWPRQDDLRDFLYLLGYHPYKNLCAGNHDFPWNEILGLFNEKTLDDTDVLKHMLRKLSLSFLHSDNLDIFANLANFKSFIQFMTPIFSSTIEGDHRIELSTRLMYGIALKEEAPFLKRGESSQFRPLPFNSTVYKPIQTVVYLPAESASALGPAVTAHLRELSRKTADQKTLYIRDSWRSLFSSIYNALDKDQIFGTFLYKTQKELYEESLHPRQQPKCKARSNRQRLSEVIADVIFAENPTATLATTNMPKPPDLGTFKNGFAHNAWTVMDNNLFSTVSKIGVCFDSFAFYQLYFSNIFGTSVAFFLNC
jgi:hypothetical protein